MKSIVQSNGECRKEVKKEAGWNRLRKVTGVMYDERVSARMKGKMYKMVRPTMLYGLESMVSRKSREAELEVTEVKMMGFSLWVARMDRISNDYIRGTTHVRCFGEKAREARLRWFRQIICSGDS